MLSGLGKQLIRTQDSRCGLSSALNPRRRSPASSVLLATPVLVQARSFSPGSFQLLSPQPGALPGVEVTPVRYLALGLAEPHAVGLSPWLQPAQTSPRSLPTLQQIYTSTQLGVACELTEGALDPLMQVTDKDVKQNWPQYRALGMRTDPLTATPPLPELHTGSVCCDSPWVCEKGPMGKGEWLLAVPSITGPCHLL